MRASKIVLGTAHFGMPYGINKKEVELDDIGQILDYAKKNKINYLDTAPTYKNALEKLSTFSLKEWNIISKIPSKPKDVKDIKSWINKIFFYTLNTLKIDKIDTILIHDENNICHKKNGDEFYKSLNDLKNQGLIRNIGCSIYIPKKLIKILGRYKFDIIQSPYNIFDKRILLPEVTKILHKKKIKLHLRSIFLQGLLLRKQNIPKKFVKNKILKKFNIWLKETKSENISTCLGCISQIKFDKLVVGIDNKSQLNDIIKNVRNPSKKIPSFNVNENNIIIDPRKW